MNATKKYIHQVIDKMDQASINEMCRLIKQLSSETAESHEQSLFSNLRQIQVEGPANLAADCDACVLEKNMRE